MKILVTSIALAASLVAASAFADSDYYAIASITHTDYDIPSVSVDDTTGVGFGIGRDINDLLSVEITYDYLGRGDTSAGGASTSFYATSVGLNLVAAHSIASFEGKAVKAVFSVGYACNTINAKTGATYVAFNDSAPTAGVGIALTLSSSTDVVVEYKYRELSDFNIDLDTVGVTFKHRF